MGSLPPPPDHPAWVSAWEPSPASPPDDQRPAWRQGRPGWAIAHVAIGSGLTFVGLFAIGVVMAIAGRTQFEVDEAHRGLVSLGTFLLLGGSITGWLCFAYGRTTNLRWGLLVGLAGGSWLVALILFLQAAS